MTKGAFAAIFNEKKEILLLKRDRKTRFQGWNLPGGGINHGETPEEAVIREVWEETGLVVRVSSKLGFYDKKKDGQLIDRAFVFLCEITGGQIDTGEENQAWGWFAKNHLPGIVQVPCEGYPNGRMVVMVSDAFK